MRFERETEQFMSNLGAVVIAAALALAITAAALLAFYGDQEGLSQLLLISLG